jgi:hypothetical protein
VEPPQVQTRVKAGGYGPGSSVRSQRRTGERLRKLANRVGPEAAGKDCGVPVARLQGKSWAPTPSIGLR